MSVSMSATEGGELAHLPLSMRAMSAMSATA
jgi:hypothetical protein